jgi:hypothetical protein
VLPPALAAGSSFIGEVHGKAFLILVKEKRLLHLFLKM